MDLRLHHPHRPRQGVRGLLRLVHRERRRPLRQRPPVLPQQLLGLVLVDVHAEPRGLEISTRGQTPCLHTWRSRRKRRSSGSDPVWYTICQATYPCQGVIASLRDGYIALREAIISISTFAPIGSAATAMVERAG